jgi:hypothetical protein
LVKPALCIPPNQSIKELGDDQWGVVRVSDDLLVDIMTEAGGVPFDEAADGIEIEVMQGVPVPFAGPELLLKLRRGYREKDGFDRDFVRHAMKQRKTDHAP